MESEGGTTVALNRPNPFKVAVAASAACTSDVPAVPAYWATSETSPTKSEKEFASSVKS